MKDPLSIEGLTPEQIAEFLEIQEEHEKGEICKSCGEKNCGIELDIGKLKNYKFDLKYGNKPIDRYCHCECGCINCRGADGLDCDEARSWKRRKKKEKK